MEKLDILDDVTDALLVTSEGLGVAGVAMEGRDSALDCDALGSIDTDFVAVSDLVVWESQFINKTYEENISFEEDIDITKDLHSLLLTKHK